MTIMSTPTKKTWQSLTFNIAEDIEHVEWEVRDVLKEADQRIDNTKNTIEWDWDYCEYPEETPCAIYWDDATDEDKAMLDYAAKFQHSWYGVRQKVAQARQLLQEAYEELNQLRMED